MDFLYGLSAGSSLIRVRSMSLQPDQPRMRLMGNMTLVASYQRQTPLKAVATAAAPGKTNVPPPKTSSPTTLPGTWAMTSP